MSVQVERANAGGFGFVTLVVVLLLVVVMVVAMFTTRSGAARRRAGLDRRIHRFEENVDRRLDRMFGDVM